MKQTGRASYKAGINWIAWNDDPTDLDVDSISKYISVTLLGDLFGKDRKTVAQAILRVRKNEK